MAIDSENKRRSAQLIHIYPIADGTIAAADRAQAAGFYAGLTYAAVIRRWIITISAEDRTLAIDDGGRTITVEEP